MSITETSSYIYDNSVVTYYWDMVMSEDLLESLSGGNARNLIKDDTTDIVSYVRENIFRVTTPEDFHAK